jgi:ATP-binding cassette subfamily F protein 3
MLSVSNISIHFTGQYLFDNVSFTVNRNDRIGLIGRNGTGKTTLLRIIAGLEQPESGLVSIPNDFHIGYLPQEGIVESDKTVFAETKTALVEIRQLEKDIKRINEEILSRTDYESAEYINLVQKLSEANDRYKHLGGHSIEQDIEQVLTGLGFERSEFSRHLKEFSGGWQMRVELAKILITKPECILLDEPTNHLDIESIQWLENFLKNYSGAIIMVSHDRAFLDAVTNRTIEIEKGKIYDRKYAYSEFVKLREQERLQLLSAFKNQQKEIAKTERFIERFRSKNTLATRVQSKIKQLEKIERIEVDEKDNSSIVFHFPEPPRAGRVVANARSLSKSYGEKLILANIDFALERGEKVAFVGKNGEGKTTLSKIIAGIEEYDGVMELGFNVSIGYFAQHQAEMLDSDQTVFQIIDNAATGEMRTQVRNLLGAFLFSGDDIDKKVKVLSGGEKSRLAISRMLLQPTNLLIMDEPTNHLDMASKDVLKEALLSYQGALILVSHDRDFLNDLTTKTIYFRNKKIKEYPGSINEFLERFRLDHLNELEIEKRSQNASDPSSKPSNAKIQREEQKKLQREQNKIEKKISLIEKRIEDLESSIAECEELFADPDFFSNIELSQQKQKEYDDFRKQLENEMSEWETLHLELEELSENGI